MHSFHLTCHFLSHFPQGSSGLVRPGHCFARSATLSGWANRWHSGALTPLPLWCSYRPPSVTARQPQPRSLISRSLSTHMPQFFFSLPCSPLCAPPTGLAGSSPSPPSSAPFQIPSQLPHSLVANSLRSMVLDNQFYCISNSNVIKYLSYMEKEIFRSRWYIPW